MAKKKEKITYVDDGRTIADMSGVSGGWTKSGRSRYTPPASFKEQWPSFRLLAFAIFESNWLFVITISITSL